MSDKKKDFRVVYNDLVFTNENDYKQYMLEIKSKHEMNDHADYEACTELYKTMVSMGEKYFLFENLTSLKMYDFLMQFNHPLPVTIELDDSDDEDDAGSMN